VARPRHQIPGVERVNVILIEFPAKYDDHTSGSPRFQPAANSSSNQM